MGRGRAVASYSERYDSLNLLPHQPNAVVGGRSGRVLAWPRPFVGRVSDGWREAATLVKQMQALGVSKYHPDPLAAIEDARKRGS
jgi:hypothetical protein